MKKAKSNLKGRLSYINKLYPGVKTVHDSNASIEIEVTAKDCSTGKMKEPDECAMARAIKRQLHATGAIVGPAYTYIIKGTKAFRFKTSPAVKTELTSFDRHRDFAEGVYAVSRICPSNRLGSHNDKRSGDRHITPRKRQHKTTGIRNIFEK